MDAFDVLGLAPALDLDSAELEQRYRDLSRALHPDKFVNAASSERRESLSRAVSVNEAYRALKDDLTRAEVVFARRTGKGSAAATSDPELLMEVMELREDLASARKRGDLARAFALSADVRERERAARANLGAALLRLEAAPDPLAEERAARALGRLRYYRRFQDEATALEEDLGDS